jgi:hypothetical protein
MKLKLFFAFLSISLVFSCIKEKTIVLTNNSDIDLKNKPVRISRTSFKDISEKNFFPLVISGSDTIPCQLNDLDGDGKWDEVFFVADLNKAATGEFTLSWVNSSFDYFPKTGVRFGKRNSKNLTVLPKKSDTLLANQVHAALGYQPFQTDGPSWENDKVGFRHYFDGRNAKDLFGKKVAYISPADVGINANGAVEDNYHVMLDWGRDILAVGNSAGLGGIAMMIGDSLARMGIVQGDTLNVIEESVFSILNQGPVYSSINFNYKNWHAGNRVYQVNEKIEIWPGIYGYKNEVTVSGLLGDETLLAGLVKINTDKEMSFLGTKDFVILYTHDQQTYDKIWYLGMALIIPKNIYLGYGRAPDDGGFSKTYYAKIKAENDVPVSYYAIGCWELADEGFRDEQYFTAYLLNCAMQLEANILVKTR